MTRAKATTDSKHAMQEAAKMLYHLDTSGSTSSGIKKQAANPASLTMQNFRMPTPTKQDQQRMMASFEFQGLVN